MVHTLNLDFETKASKARRRERVVNVRRKTGNDADDDEDAPKDTASPLKGIYMIVHVHVHVICKSCFTDQCLSPEYFWFRRLRFDSRRSCKKSTAGLQILEANRWRAGAEEHSNQRQLRRRQLQKETRRRRARRHHWSAEDERTSHHRRHTGSGRLHRERL